MDSEVLSILNPGNSPETFPPEFIWGASTSAYQIEGAVNEDGRLPSIWDTFSRRRGRTQEGSTGDVAADHYHRWAEDVALMSELGLKAYRFSVAWTRILPLGRGKPNPAGLDFYDRLVDALLARGITPYPTLFHYDLPQALEDAGGWTNRDTAGHFCDYAAALARRLGDRVRHWITLNEPLVSTMLGYLNGMHAPGKRNPLAAFAAMHHLLLAHGLAVQALRSTASLPLQVGIALNLAPVYPRSESKRDQSAARLADALTNRLFLDPILRGQYPTELSGHFLWCLLDHGALQPSRPVIQNGDLKAISSSLEFVGVNY